MQKLNNVVEDFSFNIELSFAVDDAEVFMLYTDHLNDFQQKFANAFAKQVELPEMPGVYTINIKLDGQKLKYSVVCSSTNVVLQ
tara:strand:- start:698 stop:949 length:252 start_codon:yes stop_codon:yes gene_type:complete